MLYNKGFYILCCQDVYFTQDAPSYRSFAFRLLQKHTSSAKTAFSPDLAERTHH